MVVKITILVCHVIWYEPIKVGNLPAKFGGHKHSGSENVFLVYHMNVQDYIIKESCDFMGGSPSW